MPTHQEPTPPFRQPDATPHSARIKVVGVGGGGSNAIDRMIDFGVEGVEFIALNTDVQALEVSKAPVRGQLGSLLTNGLSAGSDPNVGRRAAIQDVNEIAEVLEGADMVFVTAGLGGGTGTGAAPVIAAIASELGALTVAIVTRPFNFEGKRRMAIADWGIDHLLRYVDTLIVIPNEKLLDLAKDAPFFESFKIADDFLRQAVQSITDIITTEGVINRDFADVKTIMAGMGYAVMGTASRSGPTRAVDAVMDAMASPLLEEGAIDGARGILINITGSSTLRLSEVNAASRVIQSVAHEDANIIFGAVLDERLGDEVKATVIATGFRNDGRDRSGRRERLLRAGSPEAAKLEAAAPEPMRREAPEPKAVEPLVAKPVIAGPLIAEPEAEVETLPIEESGNETPLAESPLAYQSEAIDVTTARIVATEVEVIEVEAVEAIKTEFEVVETITIEEEQVEASESTFEESEAEALEVEPLQAVPEQIEELAQHEDPYLETEAHEGQEAPVEDPPERYSLESDDVETVEIETIEESHSELHDEEDWREAIREIALLAEPTFKVENHDNDEAAELSHRPRPGGSPGRSEASGLERNQRLSNPDVEGHGSVARTSAPPKDLAPAAPINVTTPHLSPTRRAAMAAYAAVSRPETETETETEPETDDSQTKSANAFAQVLEARRRFVENLGKSLPVDESATTTLAAPVEAHEQASSTQLQSDDSSSRSWQDESATEPDAELARQRQVRPSRPLTIDAEPPRPAAPSDKASGVRDGVHRQSGMPLFTDAAATEASKAGDRSENTPPKPLPDSSRSLRREGTEERNGELFESHWNSEIRVPTFGSISDRKS